MSATLTTPAMPLLRPGGDRPRPRGLTLEQRLENSFSELQAGATTACPVCRAPMLPAPGGGRCSGCGSQLS